MERYPDIVRRFRWVWIIGEVPRGSVLRLNKNLIIIMYSCYYSPNPVELIILLSNIGAANNTDVETDNGKGLITGRIVATFFIAR